MNPFVEIATDTTFDAVIQAATRPVIVDFWAAWCQPCLRVSPILDALAEERADALTVAKVNVDEEPELARRFGIQSIPTLIRFDGGKETHRVIGVYPKSHLLAQLGLEE